MQRIAIDTDAIIARLRGEFLDVAAEKLGLIERALTESGPVGPDRLLTIRRETHSLKGMGGSFDFPSITVLSHRLEDYLAEAEALSQAQVSGAQRFVDVMARIVSGGADLRGPELSAALAGLPARFDQVQAPPDRKLEALIVTPSRLLDAVVGRALHGRGFRTSATGSGLEALQLGLRRRPDLVVGSAVTRDLKGADLARAFAAVSITAGTPFLLMTTLPDGHADLSGLPDTVRLMRVDRELADQLDRALATCRFDA